MFSLTGLENYLSAWSPALNIMAYIIILTGLFSIINQTLYFTYFWQLKEYRLDRMNDFLLTRSGVSKFFPHFWGAKMVAGGIAIFVFILGQYGLLGTDWMTGMFLLIPVLAGICAVWEICDFAVRLKKRRIYRPDKTVKALMIVALTAIPLLLLFAAYCYYSGLPLQLPFAITIIWLISFAVFPFNALIIFLFWPITLLEKNRAIARATHKVAQMQGLKVIGITGSYGKSSTKEFLAAILESKFRVLKTPGNTNTDIGVASVVMRDLKPEHEVFIVEAGAYKIGEIKKIVDLAKPRIGIITAVKDAHLGLFGSLENIKKAKFELIEGLPEFGTAIFNADSEGSLDLSHRAEKNKLAKVLTYSVQTEFKGMKAENIKVEKESVNFEVEGVKFELMACGAQSVSNALAAITAAKEMGLKIEEMVIPLKQAKLRNHTMSLKKASPELWLIDDTYNANPDGVIAGLEYLKDAYKDWQKIIVFPGMLELGKKTSEEHQRVAKKIAQVFEADGGLAIFTSRDYQKDLETGLGEFKNFEFIDENKVVLARIKEKSKGKKTVILFISRGAETVIKALS